MKRRNWISCFLFGCVFSVCAKDPLVKDVGEASVDQESQFNLVAMAEYYRVPAAALDEWYADNGKDGKAGLLREAILQWVDGETASLVDVMMVNSRSGQRAKSESVNLLVYPSDSEPLKIDPNAPQFPTAFDTVEIGSTLEIDMFLGADGETLDLNVAPQRAAYMGERRVEGSDYGGQVLSSDVVNPTIKTQAISSAYSIQKGEWVSLGVFEPFDGSEEMAVVGLMTVDTLLVSSEGGEVEGGARFRFEWVDVKIKDWLASVRAATMSEVCHELYGKLDFSAGGNAEMVSRVPISGTSGNRAKAEASVEGVRYGTKYSPPVTEGGRAGVMDWEIREVGSVVEIDPVFTASGIADINMAPEWSVALRDSVHYRAKDEDGKWVPTVTTPQFHLCKASLAITVAPGTSPLLSVMTPIDEDGEFDPSKKRLLFLHHEGYGN